MAIKTSGGLIIIIIIRTVSKIAYIDATLFWAPRLRKLGPAPPLSEVEHVVIAQLSSLRWMN